ncbi:MAG TPA: hypothetical protein VD931_18660, partial [Baekduia sp.]|nr:hypothetical protein [Baekduia sp.]
MSSPLLRRPRHLLAVASVAIAAGAGASTASAGVLVESATSCETQTLTQPFTPWLDFASYTPAPNGTLEAGASQWTVDDAAVVSDNEPWQVAADNGSRSLRIEAGGSATTRAMCVGLEHPTIRFFAKRTSAGILAS